MSRRLLVALCALCLAETSAAQFALPPKQVAAPPAEIEAGHLRLPDPASAALRSTSAMLPVTFNGAGVWEQSVPVERGGRLTLVPLVNGASTWDVEVAEPGGAWTSLDAWVTHGRATAIEGYVSPSLRSARATRYELSTVQSGEWSVRVTSRSRQAGAVLLASSSAAPSELVTQLAHWDLTTVGRPALRVHLAGGIVTDAVAHVRHEGGARWALPLFDDGQHDDLAPDDGVFGVHLPVTNVGVLDVRVEAYGVDAFGDVLRTTQQRVTIHDDVVQLGDVARGYVFSERRMTLAVPARVDDVDRALHVSAEVWGTTVTGERVPVAWLSTMTTVATSSPEGTSLALSLDARWLARAGAGLPLELRGLRVQDPDTHVPLARKELVAVAARTLPAAASRAAEPIDTEMLTGFAIGSVSTPGTAPSRPGGLRSSATESEAAGPLTPLDPEPTRALLLTHGYCSTQVWSVDDFSGERILFSDLDANRSHDEFAQLLGTAGLAADSFGVVAHSQGGQAALHLLTYYMSGLDLATDGRRIQSVGTPYQGTPLAGSLASLGDIFGTGCGTNDDLAPAGSTLWLAGIPMWARAEVWYWTTSTGGFWCNFATNLVLSNPEDGVVEQSRAQLPGGNGMGNTSGWCHTTGMNDPAQYTDQSRNDEMDAEAAR